MATDDEQIKYAYTALACWTARVAWMTPEDREDVAQACMERLWRRWVRYDPSRGSWRTYVCVCLRTALATELARLRRSRRLVAVEEMDEAARQGPPTADLRASLEGALEPGLALDCALLRLDGLSPRDAARALGVPLRAVREALREAREAISGPSRPSPAPPGGSFREGGAAGRGEPLRGNPLLRNKDET